MNLAINNFLFTIIYWIALTLSISAYANNNLSVEFFSANNTDTIDAKTAYQRLTGKTQSDLKNKIINIMQNNHLEQGKTESIIGTYYLKKEHKITANNTEIFYTSPKQSLSYEKIFSIAKQLANTLRQESIAVFIPVKKSPIGDITVNFVSDKNTITQIINKLNKKLPAYYSQAFSLHLTNTCAGFDKATVTQIEWLGSQAKINEINQAFPGQEISYHSGVAYLVYSDGRVERL